MAKTPSDSDAVHVSARIRTFMPWESEEQCYKIQDKVELGWPSSRSKVIVEESDKVNLELSDMQFMRFAAVFDRQQGNKAVFGGTAKLQCDNMMEHGFNSLLFVYGQTGSGKTFTLLGDPGRDDSTKGILSLSIDYLLHHSSAKVKQCHLSAVEIYSTSTHGLEMFDLFDAQNVSATVNDWYSKRGKWNIDRANMIQKKIDRATDVNALVRPAQSAAHYAPTGKNPQSSRGHIAFIVEVGMADGHSANLLCLDLAGSEGLSAITPEFEAEFGTEVSKTRLQEAGAINYGLTHIESILKEAASKKGVGATQGDGIRKLLWPYVQRECQPMIHVLFLMSPSWSNIGSTRNTLRVARVMAGLQIKPVLVERKVSAQDTVKQLKRTLRDREAYIRKLEHDAEASKLSVAKVPRLDHRKTHLLELRVQIQVILQRKSVDRKRRASLDRELKDINKELENTKQHMASLAQTMVVMDCARSKEKRRRFVLNRNAKILQRAWKQRVHRKRIRKRAISLLVMLVSIVVIVSLRMCGSKYQQYVQQQLQQEAASSRSVISSGLSFVASLSIFVVVARATFYALTLYARDRWDDRWWRRSLDGRLRSVN